jgi:hypothetical protein
LAAPSRVSDAWYGIVTWAARLTLTREVSIPRSASMSSSAISIAGLTTTPAPITEVMCG